MRIAELSSPVVATKSDWLAGSTWMGFTPRQDTLSSRNQCQATVQSQFRGGFVLEYITVHFGRPNPGYEADPTYLEELERHASMAGRLVALHRLRPTSRRLEEVVGRDQFDRLQDMWARSGDRTRWSVAFPIIETFEIVGWPRARDVFDPASYRRLYAHPTGLLQPLLDTEREQMVELEIEPKAAMNAWIAIEDEMAAVERSELDPRLLRLMEQDFGLGAMEGETEERRRQHKRRAAWLARQFVIRRQRQGRLICDQCGFDPAARIEPTKVRPRSLLDVHHKSPLSEGKRYTSLRDFALLCPTCHRVEHALLRIGDSLFAV